MAYNIKDYYFEVTAGNVGADAEVIHKFGHNDSVGTSYVPICVGGVYRTPQYNASTTLRIKAGGNANDTLAGTGARQVTLEGICSLGQSIVECVDLAGASASAATTQPFTRLFRAYVSASGTYASASAGSHAANIVVEDGAGTEDWGTIELEGFPLAQTTIASYTVPKGKTAYVKNIVISVDSGKAATILFFQRPGTDEITAPYKAMRVALKLGGITGQQIINTSAPFGPYGEHTDIGFMGKVASGSAEIDVNFEIILRDQE